jgi:hypothetical protein
MPKEKKAASEKPERKSAWSFMTRMDRPWLTYAVARSSGGGGRKKLTAYNKFMQTEMARLKEDEPDITHQAR